MKKLPKSLAIIGGGYIGLEFASIFNNFGVKVTIIQNEEAFIPREDEEIAQKVLESLVSRNIKIIRSATTKRIVDNAENATIEIETSGGKEEIIADAILVATGRRPNVAGLSLEKANVQLTERGAIKTNERLQTTQENIYAMGDVVGGLQFTYISLDDYRIVKSQLFGNGERTTENRGNVPYTVFIDPPLSRVGMTEKEAIDKGYSVKVAKMPAIFIPKSKILRQTNGMLKVIVDEKTNLILGAHLFNAESQEMINIVKIAMDAKLPYMALRDAIYTHPTMSEGLNDLFSLIK